MDLPSPLKQRIRVLSSATALSRESIQELDLLKNQALWSHLDREDCRLLSTLFLKKGVEEVGEKSPKADSSFDAALVLSDFDPMVALEVAKAWRKAKRLDMVACVLEKTLKTKPESQEVKRALALSLLDQARSSKEIDLLHRVEELFSKLSPDAELLMAHGETLFLIAQLCQEPLEYKRAIDLLQRSERLGYRKKDLYLILAEAFCELASLMGAPETFLEAEVPLLRVVELESKSYEGWLRLGGVYRGLYEMGYSDAYFEKAESAFLTAAKLQNHGPNPGSGSLHSKVLWLSWGHMYLNEGRMKRNPDIIQNALQKFERAKALFPDDLDVECFLSDALLSWGILEEKLDPLVEAKERLQKVLARHPNEISLLLLLGTVLLHIGKYFHDENKILSSFVPVEKAISQSPHQSEPWHLLGLAHFAYGEMTEDPLRLEKAVGCFSKSLQIDNKVPYRILNDWGSALMRLSDITGELKYAEEAVSKFERAIALFQGRSKEEPAAVDPEWLYNLGVALDYVGDLHRDPSYYEKSVQILTKLVAEFPHFTQARYNLAISLSHLGEAVGEPELLELSLAHLDFLLKEDPEDEVALSDSAVNYIILGEMHLDAHGFQEAKTNFQEAKDRLFRAQTLGSLQAPYWLACLHSVQGFFPEALLYLQKSHELGSLPAKALVEEEEWLQKVRGTSGFRNWFDSLEY